MNIFRFLFCILFLACPITAFTVSDGSLPQGHPAPMSISLHRIGFIVYFENGNQCAAGRATVQTPRTQQPDMLEFIGKAILGRPEIVEKCPNAKVIVWLIHGISM